MKIAEIFENNQLWVTEKLRLDSNYFKNLSKGQKPEILYIGCSDSRVSAEEMMGLGPGDAFVHRNIANLVVNTDLSCMSVLNFAIKNLKINHIVVCGHYDCGGVRAAMQAKDLGILNPWLREIRDVYRLHKLELNSIEDENRRYKRLIELNVQEQCINIIKTAAVQKAYKKRQIQVYGWVFDIESGLLIDMKINFPKILAEIMEIYELH